MRREYAIVIALVLALAMVLGRISLRTGRFFKPSRPSNAQAIPLRIISLAPSITETLFALGLGDRVVGVTSYCRYPPQADSIEKVGGYVDANLEKIVALKPDLVVLQKEHEKQRTFLARYHIKTIIVHYGTVAGICSSFAHIGQVCGAQRKADSLIARFDSVLQIDTTIVQRPKVLLCVGRDSPGGGAVRSVYAAGAGTFYNRLILAAGGRNAFPDTVPQYPKLSREGLITLAPDIVIDVAPAMGKYLCSALMADWHSVDRIPAVRTGRVHCLVAKYTTVPGPRVLDLVQDLRQIIGIVGE